MSSNDPFVGTSEWWNRRIKSSGRRSLDTPRIVEEALLLARESGLASVTMRRLAQRLNTGAASLYRHLEGRDALLLLMVDHVFGVIHQRLVARPLPATWPEALHQLATISREVLMEHAAIVGALPLGPHIGPNALLIQEHGLVVLRRGGFSPRKALLSFIAVTQWVLGFVIQECTNTDRQATSASLGSRLQTLPASQLPELTGLGSIPYEVTSDEEFKFGLELLLRGLGNSSPSIV